MMKTTNNKSIETMYPKSAFFLSQILIIEFNQNQLLFVIFQRMGTRIICGFLDVSFKLYQYLRKFTFILINISIMLSKKVKDGSVQMMDIKDYELLTTIGEGSLGRVRLAKKKGSGRILCVKIMKKEEVINSKQIDHIINEFAILKTISHPFIVKFQGAAQNSKNIFLFQQFLPGGELFTHLREEGKFQPSKAAFYASQVVLTFQYLHSLKIIYRDLKPQNLLFGVDGYLKLIDFGFAKVVDTRTFTLCGTPQYIAPEILQNKGHGRAADWWTLGVLIYEMIAGIDPFADQDPLTIYRNILKGKLCFPKDFDNDARSLVRHLLVSDLSKRYGNLKNGIDDIKNHRYLNSIDWSRLYAKKIRAPYEPVVKSTSDTSHFFTCQQNQAEPAAIPPRSDPFLDWNM